MLRGLELAMKWLQKIVSTIYGRQWLTEIDSWSVKVKVFSFVSAGDRLLQFVLS